MEAGPPRYLGSARTIGEDTLEDTQDEVREELREEVREEVRR